ncbi:LysR family transcriptional regulator [Erythrobacter westpacificensis]
MDLRRIRYFVAVADHLHFGRAADSMNVVAPAVSQQIKRLEEEVGTRLFERRGSSVSLTDAGRQILPECRALIAQAEEVRKTAQAAIAGTSGHIKFGFVDNAICGLLPPLVRTFRAHFPDVELELASLSRLDQLAALESRKIDIGLLPGPIPPGDLDCAAFATAHLVAALPQGHKLAAHNRLTMDMLAGEEFVLFPSSVRSRIVEIVLASCASHSFSPRVTQEANQMHTLLALVDAGLGLTLVPQWVVSPNQIHNIAFRSVVDQSTPYELVLAWRKDSSNLALDSLRTVAKEVSAELEFPTL